MKRVLSFLLIFLFSAISSAAIDFTKEELNYIKSNKVKVAMLPDFPPFSMYRDGELKGFSYDILELISKKSGLEFIYEVDKWPVNLQKFKEKKVDIIDSISFREKRLAFTYYTKPYYEIPLVIFSRKELNNYTNLESLKGKRLGQTKNIFYKKEIEDLEIFDIKEYDSFKDKLRALAFGEVDVIFGHLLSTQIAIEKSQYTNMKVLGELNLPTLSKTDLRFGITKGNKPLYNIVKKSIDSISKVEWNDLTDKWISVYTNTKKNFKNHIVDLTPNQKEFLIKNKISCVVSKWPPFNVFDNGKLTGIGIEFWELIQKKTLIDSAKCLQVESFGEVLDRLKEKKSDVTISTAITEDKLSFGRFSIPYVSYPIAIATTLDKTYISNTKSLNGKKVGVGKSYSSSNILKEKYPQIKLVEFTNNLEALQALSKGEVYAVVDILPVLSNIIGEYGFKNIKISGTTEFNFDVRIMVREDYKELIPIINKGINGISKQESQEIKNRWVSVKFENLVDYTKLWQIGVVIFIILFIIVYRQQILNNHNRKLKEANNEIESKTNQLQEKTRQLAKQKKLFEKMFYESSDGILLARAKDSVLVDCNEVAYKLLAYEKKEDFLVLKPQDVVPVNQPDGSLSLDIIFKMLNLSLEKGSCQFELVHKRKDDSQIWLDVVVTSISIENEELFHIVWRDIQGRKAMEDELNILTNSLEVKIKSEIEKNEEKTRQLIQQSRLAQMGEMISMIAHQWRQPLTAISATANNLLIRMMIDEKIEKKELEHEVSLISDYSQHLSLTIDDFRNFFKSDKEKITTTMERVIENSISIVRSSFDSNAIELITEFNCNKEITIFATEINQVILNLLKNAEDALVENLVLDSYIFIKTYEDNSNVIIEIRDNAGGIEENIIDKIFDPYFSTKTEKEGTGLGLYMSKIIINDHCGGNLSVSNDEKGAVFKIEIPLNNSF